MDAEARVRELTRKGVMVTPEMLAEIKSGRFPEDMGAVPEQKRPVKRKLSVKIIKPPAKERMSTGDFVKYYNNRYSSLRSMIEKKVKAVSINKVGDGFGETCLIGMIRERTSSGFTLEDATGEIEVVGKSDARQDDVVGARGSVREGKLILTSLTWPDVPLTKEPTFIKDFNILFAGELDQEILKVLDDFNLVFLLGKPTQKQDKIISELPNPCHATVMKDGQELRILIFKPGSPVTEGLGRELLQRRHLSPDTKDILSTTDPFLIDPIPDVFWIIGGKKHVERYKGVTIIMSQEKDAVKYDAATGKVFFANEG